MVEIDGENHFTPEHRAYDLARDKWMKAQGCTVLRFTGKLVEMETSEVLDQIERETKLKSDSRAPYPPTP